MPPIPVHIDDPITPQKAKGVTPSTTEYPTPGPGNNPPSTSNEQTPYPAARPGASPAPGPTPYAPQPQPQSTRTYQPAYQDGPPSPQPGAVPSLPTQQAPMTANSHLPPPPRAGQSLQQPPATSMPNQMYMPSPQQNSAPTHGTTAGLPPPTAAQQLPRPTTLNYGPVSSPAAPGAASQYGAGHLPGYQQNVYAQELTPAQGGTLDAQERKASTVGGFGFGGGGAGGGSQNHVNDGASNVWDGANETANSMWNSVKGWASVAGTKLAETEEEIWKRVNGQ